MSWLTSEESIERYKDALTRAATDDETFANFRSEHGVREIVEGIPDVAGQGYFDKLKDIDVVRVEWDRVTANDRVGNPRRMPVEGRSPAAPATLRYAWNVFDMVKRGIALDNADIVEVGGGYGGLCRMIHAFYSPKSYTIVDLPEALALADRYLKCYGIDARMVSCDAYNEEPIDTFISNYALTELTKDVQSGYANKLLKRARYGYITYNSQPRNAASQYSLADLATMAPGKSEIYEENVKRSECQVLVWRPE